MNLLTLRAFVDELEKIAQLHQIIEKGIQRSERLGRMPFIPLRGAAARGMEVAKQHGIQDVRGLSHIAKGTTISEGGLLHILGKGVSDIPRLEGIAQHTQQLEQQAAKFAPKPAWKPPMQSGISLRRGAVTGQPILQRPAA